MFVLDSSVRKGVTALTFTYFGVPLFLFFWNWFSPYIALPLFTLLVAAAYVTWKDEADRPDLPIPGRSLLVIFLLVVFWSLLSGVGGYFYQNGDFLYRNPLFRDLVHYPWPVKFPHAGGDVLLVYYFCYWLPAAAVGKIGGMAAANGALFLWTTAGLLLFFYQALLFLRKGSAWPVLILILFGTGCDIIPFYVYRHLIHQNFIFGQHFEWWVYPFQYSSLTSCLYWVFNQAVPVWIGTVWMMNQRSYGPKFFIAALVYPFAPFGSIGMVMLLGLMFLLERLRGASCEASPSGPVERFEFAGHLFAGAVALALIFTSSTFFSTTGRGMRIFFGGGISPGELFWALPLFLVLDFGILAVFLLFLTRWDKTYLYAAMAILLGLPAVQIISVIDFVMRVSLPAVLILGLYTCGVFIDGFAPETRRLRTAFIVFFFLCALTPLSEIFRSVAKTVKGIALSRSYTADGIESLAHPSAYAEKVHLDNLLSTGYQESLYWRCLRRR